MNRTQNPANGFNLAEIHLTRDQRKQMRDLQKQRRSLDKRTQADEVAALDAKMADLLDSFRKE